MKKLTSFSGDGMFAIPIGTLRVKLSKIAWICQLSAKGWVHSFFNALYVKLSLFSLYSNEFAIDSFFFLQNLSSWSKIKKWHHFKEPALWDVQLFLYPSNIFSNPGKMGPFWKDLEDQIIKKSHLLQEALEFIKLSVFSAKN